MKFFVIALSLALILTQFVSAAPPVSDGDTDWEAVMALDAGPKTPVKSREEGRTVALAHFEKQEAALREYLAAHPASKHVVDAQLRLAHLLAMRSDLIEKPAPYLAAISLLDEALKTAPEARKADIVFARIAMAIRRVGIPTDNDRVNLTDEINAFQKHFPNDRRVAPLFAEIATLYDKWPKRKAAILKHALEVSRDEELRSRIVDDLKRLEFLGRPVALEGATADGKQVDIATLQGKVVLVYFFASWSPPSVAGLDEVAYLKRQFRPDQLEAVGVNLDNTRQALDAVLKARGIDWPVIWDGKGWESPTVRSLAINALPTLWILDKHSNLRTLNALTESESLVRTLLKEK